MTGIVGAFPSTIQNGTPEDATQVMALFAYIQSQVNANACPATSGSSVLKANGSGGTASAVAGTDFLVPAAGMVFDYAGVTIPAGYLQCNGSDVSRTAYATLFAAIGTVWGAGDGSTTFTLPDLRRRTTIGAGGVQVAGPTTVLGAVGGEEAHPLTVAELAAHNHTINITDPTHVHTVNDPTHAHNFASFQNTGGGFLASNSISANSVNNTTTSASTGISLNAVATGITAASVNAGSGNAHNTMQPSAVVYKIIKT